MASTMKIEDKKLSLAETASPKAAAAELMFASGARLMIDAVMLYERSAVERVLEMRIQAYALLQVDPALLPVLEDWAITPAMLVTALNRDVPARKADEAEALLRQAEAAAEEVHAEGRFVPLAEVERSDAPRVHLWQHAESVFEQHKSRSLFGSREVEEEVEQLWIHDGGPFVTVRDEHGTRREVRWASVEQYRLVYAGDDRSD